MINNLIRTIDIFLSKMQMFLNYENNSLILIYFHKIFKDKDSILQSEVDPQQGTTIKDFELTIEYFIKNDYFFISPEAILKGLNSRGKYILITFDDGYYNNSFVLPVLEKYKIPALFFISVTNVIKNKSFWWDIIYSLNCKGYSNKKIRNIKSLCKIKNPTEIDEFLKTKLNINNFSPKNEFERCFTPNELRDFSKNKYVTIGNHTMDHAILRNCSRKEIEYQINNAQTELKNIVGYYPKYISYPNGNSSNDICEISKNAGLEAGFSCIRGKNLLKYSNKFYHNFRIKRFIIPTFNNNHKALLNTFRSKFSIYNVLVNLYSRWYK